MSKFAIGITVILVSCFALGCGGKTSNESASNSDSKTTGSKRPNRNKQPNGNQDNTIPANEDNLDTKPDTSSNVTFDEKSGLPSDIPIPEFVSFSRTVLDAYKFKHMFFKSQKPSNETLEIMKSKLLSEGWKIESESKDSLYFYKSSKDITKLSPKQWPKDTRSYQLIMLSYVDIDPSKLREMEKRKDYIDVNGFQLSARPFLSVTGQLIQNF